MFSLLSDKLQDVFKNLRGQGKISETNVQDAMREVRMALLEADVEFSVAKAFIARVKDKALGEEVLRSVTPGPTLAITPTGSTPNMCGSAGERAYLPARTTRSSVRLTDTAWTATSTSPGPGSGVGTSSSFMTPGAPNSRITIAFKPRFFPLTIPLRLERSPCLRSSLTRRLRGIRRPQ